MFHLIDHSTASRLACAATVAATLAGGAARATTVISSSDGRWVAHIADFGGATGQCSGLYDMNALVPAQRQFLANTRHYVRMGTALSFGSAVSQPMSEHFHQVNFAASDDAYTTVLASDDVPGVIAIVHGEMVSGAAGGLRVSITFADLDPSSLVLGQQTIKPFVYANLNCDGQMLDNTGGWTTDHFHQSGPGSGGVRWFRGREVQHYSSKFNSTMQQMLDNGLQELDDFTVGGPGDINAAMSFATGGLGSGSTHVVAYALGNANVSIPAAFGAPPRVGGVSINSPDDRWAALIRTGTGTGAAGEIGSVYDFNQPLSKAMFATQASYYVAVNNTHSLWGERVKDSFDRVTFLHAADSQSLFSAVLNSRQWPGLALIVDGRMLSGDQGGLIVSMRFVDTLGRGLNIAPVVYADLDADSQPLNWGGWQQDHFWQNAGKGSADRWFLAASRSTFMSGLNTIVQGALDLGVVSLNFNVAASASNLATAIALDAWRLRLDQPFVNGFAIGNAGIEIPGNFVLPSAWLACPADVAPAPLGDLQVNTDDLIAVITAWGMCPTGCAGDIAPPYLGDGAVNTDDLIAVITAWGACWKQ